MSTRNASLVPRKRLAFKSKVRVDGSKFEGRPLIPQSKPDKVDAKLFAGVSKEASLQIEGSRRRFEVREKATYPEVTS